MNAVNKLNEEIKNMTKEYIDLANECLEKYPLLSAANNGYYSSNYTAKLIESYVDYINAMCVFKSQDNKTAVI